MHWPHYHTDRLNIACNNHTGVHMLLCCDFCGYVLYMLLLAALSIHIWLYYILIRSKMYFL